MIKTILIDFLKFIIKPNDLQIESTTKSKLYITSIIFLLNGVITVVFILALLTLITKIIDLSHNNITYLTFSKSFLFLVILIPLVEELVFRYFLRYNGFKTLIISEKKWLKIFPILVYVSTICFGLLHITNYPSSTKLFFLLFPIIILPQLIGGFMISYLRVRLNFLWGVIYHATWNLTVMIIIPYISYSLTDAYSEKTSNYSIKMEYKLFLNEEKQQLKIDSIGDKILYIKTENYTIHQILDTLYRNEKYVVSDELVNLNFESKKGITKDAFIKILQKEIEIK